MVREGRCPFVGQLQAVIIRLIGINIKIPIQYMDQYVYIYIQYRYMLVCVPLPPRPRHRHAVCPLVPPTSVQSTTETY